MFGADVVGPFEQDNGRREEGPDFSEVKTQGAF